MSSSNSEHAPARKSWFGALKESLTPSSFEARPLLEKLKWFLAGGTTVAWLHSSVLVPSLFIATASVFALNKFVLKEAHHGAASTSGSHH
jgi:hypothetical protein